MVRFLDRVLRNSGGRAVAGIERLLAGESGLQRPDDRDIFEGGFGSLRDAKLSPQALYQRTLESVPHPPINDSLRLGFVRGSSGEIGLKANSSSHYSGSSPSATPTASASWYCARPIFGCRKKPAVREGLNRLGYICCPPGSCRRSRGNPASPR